MLFVMSCCDGLLIRTGVVTLAYVLRRHVIKAKTKNQCDDGVRYPVWFFCGCYGNLCWVVLHQSWNVPDRSHSLCNRCSVKSQGRVVSCLHPVPPLGPTL